MIRKIFFFLFCLLLTTAMKAGEVSEAEALQKAQTFMAGRGIQLTAGAKLRLGIRRLKAGPQDAASYYVFNVADEGGFVIVSGDDRTESILGYADTGTVSEDDMPEALRYLLDGYAEQMEWLDGQPDEACEAKPRKVSTLRTAVSPLIATRWNQGAPYNSNCPEIYGTKTVTGCVATSMAQVMYFYQYPTEDCTTIPGYELNTKDANKSAYSTTLEGLSATTFSWNDMTKTYAKDATGNAADAVAKLMQYCGWSLQMTYGLAANGGSSAYNVSIAEALKLYFGYDGGVHYAQRCHYNYQDWVSLIYSELVDGHPVVLGGQSAGGGHSFVCDGYDAGDYFHINWGWGGSSDGYFRLSALNPYEQGIGGSSTLDGFSYGQDAVIGIQRPVSETPGYCLSLEGLRFGASDTATSKTFTRTSSGENFTGISLYITLCSYRFATTLFDYAVQLVDGSGQVEASLYEADNQSMTFNKNLNSSLTSISIPNSIGDGTYYIKVMSRTNGTSDWQECYDGDRYQLTATISGNSLTVDVPIPAVTLPTAVVFTVNGDKTLGHEQEVIASITGGATAYHGDVILRVNGVAVMGKSLDIPAGQTVDAYFAYTPTTAGDNILTFYNAISNGTQIGSSTTVTITASDATDNLELTFTANISNLTGDGKLYGNALRATITATNSSTENSYAGKLNCSTRKWTVTDNGDNTYTASWESMGVTTQPLVVAKKTDDTDGQTTLTFAVDGLESDALYSFRFTYSNTSVENNVVDAIHLGLDANGFGSLKATEGYSLGDATGTTTIYPASTSIDAAAACFVDLRNLASTDGLTVTPSSNPNCLYLLADGATVPSGLTGRNVIAGTTAKTLTLTDGQDFYSPIDFTATSAAYTRTFTRAANGTSGWNTIMLPFTVSAVTCGDADVDWFHSSTDTGKNFWLKTFTGDETGSVYFDFADQMLANTPYIIAVPDNRWGTEWQMTDKAVTFSGANVTIAATETADMSGDSYKFCGDTRTTSVSQAYALNDEGSSFKYSEEAATIDPFRAWFAGSSISSLTLPALGIANGQLTGITAIGADEGTAATTDTYDLSGRKVTGRQLRPGIYIVGGKKKLILK